MERLKEHLTIRISEHQLRQLKESLIREHIPNKSTLLREIIDVYFNQICRDESYDEKSPSTQGYWDKRYSTQDYLKNKIVK